MARIQDTLLDSVVVLYRSRDDAKSGVHSGGAGFVVGVNAQDRGRTHLYVVTNEHLVTHGYAVVRLTSRTSARVIEEAPPEQWFRPNDGDGDDLAVWHMRSITAHQDSDFAFVERSLFVGADTTNGHRDYGPGDECFVPGRFVNADGEQSNQPTVRFGNVAMTPGEPFTRAPGVAVDAFLVETRSQAAYSGSPVFVYPPSPSAPNGAGAAPNGAGTVPGRPGPDAAARLLGVDFAHVSQRASITHKGTDTPHRYLASVDVEIRSSIIAVSPAWRLAALLDREDVRAARGEPSGAFA